MFWRLLQKRLNWHLEKIPLPPIGTSIMKEDARKRNISFSNPTVLGMTREGHLTPGFVLRGSSLNSPPEMATRFHWRRFWRQNWQWKGGRSHLGVTTLIGSRKRKIQGMNEGMNGCVGKRDNHGVHRRTLKWVLGRITLTCRKKRSVARLSRWRKHFGDAFDRTVGISIHFVLSTLSDL